MIVRARKKPVVIEACRVPMQADDTQAWRDLSLFLNRPCGPELPFIKTQEGTMRATWGGWIIRGVKGELYPCAADVFEATYDVVAEVVIGQPSVPGGCAGTLVMPLPPERIA